MTDAPDQKPDELPPIDPADAKIARAVHFQASLIRFLGLAIILVGLTIAMEKVPGLPSWVGVVLIVAGLFQMLVMPLMIIRRFVKVRKARAEQQ